MYYMTPAEMGGMSLMGLSESPMPQHYPRGTIHVR